MRRTEKININVVSKTNNKFYNNIKWWILETWSFSEIKVCFQSRVMFMQSWEYKDKIGVQSVYQSADIGRHFLYLVNLNEGTQVCRW